MIDISEISQLIAKIKNDEIDSQQTLHLTGYENQMSKLATSFLNSNLSFRYHLGDNQNHQESDYIAQSGKLLFKGLPGVYALEKAATTSAHKIFHAAATDFRPTSGLHAMLCTLSSATSPNDRIYSIDPQDGGHFATRHVVQKIGRKSEFIPWDQSALTIDLESFAKKLQQQPANLIFFEHGTPLFNLPIHAVRELVGPDVTLVYDASHTLGLIAGGAFQDPLTEGCDILQGNTHKTFPGPQKGLLAFRDHGFAQNIIQSISSGLVSSQHAHHAIALYITVLEMEQFGQAYVTQMLKNAQAFAHALADQGFTLVHKNGQFTSSHELLIESTYPEQHYQIARTLFHCGISTNARIAFRKEIVRIGTQEVTRRGMKEANMLTIAKFFKRACLDHEPIANIKREVQAFNQQFTKIHYSFDQALNFKGDKI